MRCYATTKLDYTGGLKQSVVPVGRSGPTADMWHAHTDFVRETSVTKNHYCYWLRSRQLTTAVLCAGETRPSLVCDQQLIYALGLKRSPVLCVRDNTIILCSVLCG